jgi:radical SAM superfamily enzyme YgiQ (UPF0313 family)
MRHAFTFFHDPSPLAKARAAVAGLADVLFYHSALSENLSLIREGCRLAPSSLVVVGGPSVAIFADVLRDRLPPRAKAVTSLSELLTLLGLPTPEDLFEPMLDLRAVEACFPQWHAYKDEEIGVQTKRGCPHACLYCLYGFLEGRRILRRQPERVVREIEEYATRWGSKRFWFVDAQLRSDERDEAHLREILEGMAGRGLDVAWSGYLRVNGLSPDLASLMVRTGLHDIEIALNSGAQSVIDELRMGFSVEDVIEGLAVLHAAGYRGAVKVDLSLNSPGETPETLGETLAVMERIRSIFGANRVSPVIFFLAVQPHTDLERRAIKEGTLKQGYDPLSVWPWSVRRLIRNPAPLGRIIGRSCALAFRVPAAESGNRVLAYLEAALCARMRKKAWLTNT